MTLRFRLKLSKLGIITVSRLFTGFLIACYDYIVLRSELSAGFSADFFARLLLFA